MLNSLASRMRQLRLEKSLTQSAVARKLQLPRVTYTHYELGKRTPDLDTLLQIAAFYDVSVDYLLGVTWLRPTLESWLGTKAEKSENRSGTIYPEPGEDPAEAMAHKLAEAPESDE